MNLLKPSTWFNRSADVVDVASTTVPVTAPVTGLALTPPMPPMRPEYIAAFRKLEEINERMVRSYDAAATDNYNADFKSTFGAANAEILVSKYAARGRTRTLAKDNPHGKAIIRTFQNNVVGDDPFRLDMRYGTWKKTKGEDGADRMEFVEDCELNQRIEAEWERFGWPENFTVRKNMSRMEAFRIMEASVVREGSILIRKHRLFPYNKYGFAVDLLEEDRLQESYMGKSPADSMFGAGNPIRFSIEVHPRYNFPLAYWILTRHPGETFMAGPYNAARPSRWREQVPADEMIHFNNLRDRAEQDIGMTELDATTQPLWRNHQYDKSLVLAAIASCMKPFIIEQDAPNGLGVPPEVLAQIMAGSGEPANPATPTSTGAPPEGGQPVQVQRPGSREELPVGKKLKQIDPKFPIEAAHDFRLDNLRDIAVGSGVSYQDVSGDFQNLGFAAALMCQTPKQDYCKIRQRNFVDSVVRDIFREWLKHSILMGVFDFDISKIEEYVAAAKFKAKRWAFVNPLVQAQTLILMVKSGLMSPQQVQDQLPDGVSIEDLYTMIAEAKAEQEKHGLVFDDGLTRPNENPDEAGKPDGGAGGEAPSKKKTGNPVRSVTAVVPRIAPEVLALIDQQGDGRNGYH